VAYFVSSDTLVNAWKIMLPFKIDVRTAQGKSDLEELEGSNEFVKEIKYSDTTNKCFALVEGKYFFVNKLAVLKYKLVVYAVENKLGAKELTRLLKPRASLNRKRFLEGVGVLFVK